MSDRLRILVIGASGDLGRAIVSEFAPRHEIITAGSKSGDIRIDIADPASIVAGLKAAGALDAVAYAAGALKGRARIQPQRPGPADRPKQSGVLTLA